MRWDYLTLINTQTMTTRFIVLLLFGFGLFSCNNPQNPKEPIVIKDRVLYPNTVLAPLFDSLRPTTQTFVIKGDQDTLLVGQNGITVIILKNTFVDENGTPATTVQLDLVEINSTAEMIKANLQTTAGDRILQTGGMFFIDAKQGNKSLAIAADRAVYVETKSLFKEPKMKIFEGDFDDNGTIDWTGTGGLDNKLLPIPLSLMNFQKCGLECSFSKEQVAILLDPKLENTYIATRAFEDRCCVLSYTTCMQNGNLSQELLDKYVNNIHQPLYYADSLVVAYLLEHFEDKIDPTMRFEFSEVGWFSYIFKELTAFKGQQLLNVINFEQLGIDASTTPEELISNGISEREAYKFIAAYRQRTQIVALRIAKDKTARLASYSFSINQLGWVNVDKFLDEKEAAPSNFLVKIKSKDTLDVVSVSLIIPSYNVAVSSSHNDKNTYSFTKKKEGYRTLPVGKAAIVVAFSYKNNQPFFGKKKIKIPKDGQIELELLAATEQEIKEDIAQLMK